jgi:hypothetical protein
MSKMAGSIDRKKSFESNFADEVRRLVSVRKKIIEVSDTAVQQEWSSNGEIAETILKFGMTKHALTLDNVDPADRLLRAVFAFCDLDSGNPWHWRILLEATIEVTFKKSGAREKWDDGALFELLMDVREVRRLNPSAKTDQRIAELLKKKEPFMSKYTMKTAYLRKLVGKAQDPRFNSMAEYNEDENFLKFFAMRRRETSGVSAEMASALIEKFVADEIEASLASFRKLRESQGKAWNEATWEALRPEVEKIVRDSITGSDVK